MRQFLVLLTTAALASGAAEAAFGVAPVLPRTPGAQLVQLENGRGRAAVTRQGSLLVNIGKGRLRVIDLAGAGRPRLSDACQRRARRVSARTVEIRGRNVRCLIWSGVSGSPWQAILTGRRISASGAVRGSLTLDGAQTGTTGLYKIGDRGWQGWPRAARTYVLRRT
jgi:hypothetical protein